MRSTLPSLFLLLAIAVPLVACKGPSGGSCTVTKNGDGSATIKCEDGTTATVAPGAAGTNGTSGTNGSCTVTDNSDGSKTIACADGTTVNVPAPMSGVDCWDLDGNQQCDVATEDKNTDGLCTVADCQGAVGPAAPGGINLEPLGLVGFVSDPAKQAVVGAKVYLVPSSDIPTAPLVLSDLNAERASADDEPLEDTIEQKGAGYVQAVTDDRGVYTIATIPAGRYFVVVMPTDDGHLPGGSACRQAQDQGKLIGTRLDLKVSTKPSATAEYVGPSVCLTCHGVTHEKKTLHMLGIRKIGKAGPLQDSSRYPDWDLPLAKFKDSDDETPTDATTLYYFAYNGNSASPDWKLSEVDPGSGVSFVAKMYRYDSRYWVKLIDIKGSSGEKTYEVDISYGGGLYKQRYAVKIGKSRYILPIQYNFQGQTDEAQPSSRWRWQQYNAQNWYDEAVPKRKEPATTKSFDNNCAGCHFGGYRLDGNSTDGFTAHGVTDGNGEMDFDGDGKLESLNITCETCHGPGSEHWYSAGQGKAIVSPELLTPEREVAICAQCHTRALGIGGNNTETPMNSSGVMMRAGTKRSEFLASYVSKLDDGLWDTQKGDGKHSKKHHQQASDFLKSAKYRNGNLLLTCASCHDPHGETTEPHQLRSAADDTDTGEGLCLSCHSPYFPVGATLDLRMQNHWTAEGILGVPMSAPGFGIGCVDCHMPKTAKSGAGVKQSTIDSVTYYSGDISSHLFDVPLRASIAQKAGDMMAIPYTSACGQCHANAP